MNLDIILVMTTMEAVVIGSVAVLGLVNVVNDYTQVRKIQSCVDSYTFTGENSHEFVQCMKGQFPSKFADAYKRKLQSEAKLAEGSQ